MPTMKFSLNISAEEYLRYYQGTGKTVVAIEEGGRQIQFPAAKLRPFVSHDGVQGWYEIEFDHNHKFISLISLKN